MVNSQRSAELAITSLISNKREWNNCFVKFLKLQKFGSTKYERKRENLMKMRRCGMPSGQTDAGPSQKILTFSRTSKLRN